ncbi:anti-sigma factor family protein [Rubripirellula reticaptiva]|uniref:Uncharacterized protein n=1 Tax=Rubripirellula reticaptiva TaxID=2528013 RepID=A0A5C6F8R3_9BACT|nr:hypothetical protein [Rubripirellula reticaptiva]TWU56109.1 hypothetical protein Poly59_24130 [Rubripirellula reticaptiva]
MHEDLLGYLLGALEPHEMRRVDQWLRDDPEARRQLADVERLLKPLEEAPPVELPPPDLIARTMASLPSLPPVDSTGRSDRSGSSSPADAAPVLVSMQANLDSSDHRGWTWLDWVASASAAAVLLALLLPSIAEGRFEARKVACQDQLRQLGTAITHFVTRNEQSRLPAVSSSGPEAFAGVYAVRLRDAGLLDDEQIRWCPSLDLPASASDMPSTDLVSVQELHVAPLDRLREIQQFAGGHYAYTLGVVEKDHLTSPRFESRSSFAVMSDAPLAGIATESSLAGSNLAGSIGHGGVGINVLYEDGRIQFLQVASLASIPDHPLLNNRGEGEAGVNVDDASLAPSWRPPFVNVRQR